MFEFFIMLSLNEGFILRIKKLYLFTTILDKNNSNTAFKINKNLGKYMKSNKYKTGKTEMSGIYKLFCRNCNNIYIGRPFINVKTLISVH